MTDSPGVNLLGLHCLRRSPSEKSIIFAHGILSDSEGAWGKPPWPGLLMDDEDLKDYSVYVFSYRTSLTSGTYSIGDATRTLKAHFDLEELWSQVRIVFVGHSMGGIVIRKFITTNQIRLASEKIDVGLFLIASPSLGARAATTITTLSWIFGHTEALALRFSQTNTWLNDLDAEFMTLKESGSLNLVGKELVEDKALPVKRWFGLKRQLVEPFAAARYFGEPLKIADSDHISIAKPGSRDALQYRLLKRFLTSFPIRSDILFPLSEVDTASARQAVEGLRRKLPSIGNWSDAISALQEALLETRAYVTNRREGLDRDAAIESRLSRAWSDAGTAVRPYDTELAGLCYVKGQGWADPKLWDDPRFVDLPTELNDMSERLLKMMAPAPEGTLPSPTRIASNQKGNNNNNAQIAGDGNTVKF
jgi:pimeloyl-ACP methyl ester carboxylesterase